MIQSGQEKILLTVGCIDTLNTTVMYPFYSQVLKEKNQINLRLRTHQSSELYGLLEKHEIDIGFVYHHLHYKNVVATPVLLSLIHICGGEEKDKTRRVYRLVLSLTCLRGEIESGYSSIQVILYNINVSKLWKIPKGFGKIINKF